MPAASEKQKKFMDAAAHNPEFAKQAGVQMDVAKDFSEKSKGLKFGKGSGSRADLQKVNKPKTRQGKMELFKKGGDTMASKMNPGFLAMMAKKKDSGKKMAEGGKADMKQDKATVKKAVGMHDKQQHMGKKTDLSKLAKGGGIESKGKTKGTMVTMKRGGKC
jgi:hypothetical protein